MNSALIVVILQVILTLIVIFFTLVVSKLYAFSYSLDYFTAGFVYSSILSAVLGGLVFILPTVLMYALMKLSTRILGVMQAVGLMLAEGVSLIFALLIIAVVAFQAVALGLIWPIFIIALMTVAFGRLLALLVVK